MHRRISALAVAVLGLLAATAAGAQTTSTSTAPTSSSTSTSSTSTSTSTTSTTVADPCAGRICTEEPPEAFLSGARGEIRLDKGSYCWRRPRNAQGLVIGLCADKFFGEPSVTLVVTRGETLTLRFDSMAPTSVELIRDEVPTPLPAANPLRFVADFPVGSHIIGFFTRWFQGDASYGVRLDVRPPAAPKPAPRGIALTG